MGVLAGLRAMAVAGMLGGYEFRTRQVAAIGGNDLAIAPVEDMIDRRAILIVRFL
jgi:uncharacterized membrane protein